MFVLVEVQWKMALLSIKIIKSTNIKYELLLLCTCFPAVREERTQLDRDGWEEIEICRR